MMNYSILFSFTLSIIKLHIVFGIDLLVQIDTLNAASTEPEDIQIMVRYNNTGNRQISIYKWCLPDGILNHSIFKVTRNKIPVNYIGPIFKRRDPTIQDTVSLPPGKILQAIVKLSTAYDMTIPGAYAVEFDVPTERVVFEPFSVNQRGRRGAFVQTLKNISYYIQSNRINLIIEGRPRLQNEQTDIFMLNEQQTRTILYDSCTKPHIAKLTAAVRFAQIYANGSFQYLNEAEPSGTDRYKTWFGNYVPDHWNQVKQNFYNIQDVLNTKSLVFNCACKSKSDYAYIFIKMPYRIYLCAAFWSAPLEGTNSKAGTLIHEISHFKNVAATVDYAYGQIKTRSLATTKPSKAIVNADSHEYFAENTPYLA